MSYQIIEAGDACTPNAPHTGTVAVQSELLRHVPGTTNLGVYLCKHIKDSPGTISLHGVYRAGDTGCPSQTGETPQGLAVVGTLRTLARELFVQRIIHSRNIWDCERGDHPYHGTDPHFNHVHWELTPEGAALTAQQVTDIFNRLRPAPLPVPHPLGEATMFQVQRHGTVWLVIPGVGKVGINNPAEEADTVARLHAAGFNANVINANDSAVSNVFAFVDKLPVVG